MGFGFCFVLCAKWQTCRKATEKMFHRTFSPEICKEWESWWKEKDGKWNETRLHFTSLGIEKCSMWWIGCCHRMEYWRFVMLSFSFFCLVLRPLCWAIRYDTMCAWFWSLSQKVYASIDVWSWLFFERKITKCACMCQNGLKAPKAFYVCTGVQRFNRTESVCACACCTVHFAPCDAVTVTKD